MSLLQSALDFLAGPGSLGGASGRDQSDFVGQTVELGELRLRVRRVLAEGEAPGRQRGCGCGVLSPGRWGQRQLGVEGRGLGVPAWVVGQGRPGEGLCRGRGSGPGEGHSGGPRRSVPAGGD